MAKSKSFDSEDRGGFGASKGKFSDSHEGAGHDCDDKTGKGHEEHGQGNGYGHDHDRHNHDRHEDRHEGRGHDHGYGRVKPGLEADRLEVIENADASANLFDNDPSDFAPWSRGHGDHEHHHKARHISSVDGLSESNGVFSGDLISDDDIPLGILTVARDGAVHFEATADALAEGEVREVLLTYEVRGFGKPQTSTLTLVVVGTNDAPEFEIRDGDSDTGTLTLGEDFGVVGTLGVSDLDLADEVIASVTGVETSGSFSGAIPDAAALLALMQVTDSPVVASGADEGGLDWSFDASNLGLAIPSGETLVLSYTLTVDDGLATAEHVVTLTLTGGVGNTPPTITVGDDQATLVETGELLTASGTLVVGDTAEDSVALAVTGVTATGNTGGLTEAALLAMLTLPDAALLGDAESETVDWSFVSGQSFAWLSHGETLTLVYGVTATDQEGATATHDITVTIVGTVEAPVLSAGALTVSESGAGVLDLSALVSGGESALSYAVVGGVPGGVVSVAGSSFSFDTAGGFEALAAGEIAVFDVGVEVADAFGGVSPSVVTVTVVGENDAPVGVADAATVGEDDGALVIDVLANDSDVDQGDSLSLIDLDTTGTLGTVTVNPDGTVSYDPAGRFDALTLGETATDRFWYIAADAAGVPTGPIEVVVTITGSHDAPVLSVGALTVSESGAGVLDLSALVSGGESALSYAVVGGVPGGLATVAGASFEFDTAGGFEALAVGETASFDVAVEVADAFGGVSASVVTVTVVGENDAPVGVADAATVGEDDGALVIDVLANDSDVDQGDSLSLIDLDTTGTLGTVTVNPDGTLSYDSKGQFNALDDGETATDTFTYRVQDAAGALSDPITVTVTIQGADDVPIIANGGFENGLAGWSTAGTATVVGRQALIGETGSVDLIEGAKMLRLYSLGAGDGTIANFLGHTVTEMEAAAGSDLIVGAAAKTVVTNVTAGDQLQFSWFFDAGDNAGFDDSALMLGLDGAFVELSDVSDVGDWLSSGWQTATITATQSGDLTLAFAVFNATDAGQNSALYVDDLHFI